MNKIRFFFKDRITFRPSKWKAAQGFVFLEGNIIQTVGILRPMTAGLNWDLADLAKYTRHGALNVITFKLEIIDWSNCGVI